MIISLHLPKCGGTSFRHGLRSAFGQTLFEDYGDRILDQSLQACGHRAARARQLDDMIEDGTFEFQAVHGHFYAGKYAARIADGHWITFMRHPARLLRSLYSYLGRIEKDNTITRVVRSFDSFEAFVEHEWFQNPVTKLVCPLSFSNFAFVGLQEDFDASLDVVGALLDRPVRRFDMNTNPSGTDYRLDPDVLARIERLNAADMAFYAQALDALEAQKRALARGHLAPLSSGPTVAPGSVVPAAVPPLRAVGA